MVDLLLISALGLLGLSLIWFLVINHDQSKLDRPLPPGPRALPLIGHLHLLIIGNPLPHRAFSALAKRHGPLMYLRLGSVHTVVASSPEMAQQVLQAQDHIFASRPETAAAVHMLFDRSSMAFAPYGPYWKHMRKLCITDMFHRKRLEATKAVRAGELRELLRGVLLNESGAAGSEQPIPIRDRLRTASKDIICRLAVSKRLCTAPDILRVLEELLHLLAVRHLGDLFPWLGRWADPQGNIRRMREVRSRMKEVFGKVIEERRAELAGMTKEFGAHDAPSSCHRSKDLLDDLLSLTDRAGSDQASSELGDIAFSDENIMAVLMDMFVAGTDSSSMVTEWALAEMLANPGVMKKAQEELDSVVGKERMVDETDLPNLPYLQAIVKESMRLHPAAPLLAPHQSMVECHIGGYYIPAGTTVLVNAWEIGRDSSVWEDAESFVPERFVAVAGTSKQAVPLYMMNGEAGAAQFKYLPFGAGRRSCPGWQLGATNTQLMLASLIHAFDWSLPPSSSAAGNVVVDMSEKFGLSLAMAQPLTVIAKLRLPSHLII